MDVVADVAAPLSVDDPSSAPVVVVVSSADPTDADPLPVCPLLSKPQASSSEAQAVTRDAKVICASDAFYVKTSSLVVQATLSSTDSRE